MEYDVRLEENSSRPLAVVRRRAGLRELAKVIPEACGTVWSVVRAQKVPGAGRHVALYWDDEFNLEVGVELATPFAGHGEVVTPSPPPAPSPRQCILAATTGSPRRTRQSGGGA